MTEPIAPPRRKNPLVRTRQPMLPPAIRSRTAHGLTRGAAESRFVLQRCARCGAYTYPARDACPVCLSAELSFVDAPRAGILLSETSVAVPAEIYFRERAPWRVGLVALECGPTMLAHLHADCREGEAVRLSLQLDKSGNAVAFARPERETPNAADDPEWRELTADPKFRRVLITNGRSAVGEVVAAALAKAGASTVFVGLRDAWKPWPGEPRIRELAAVKIVPLDVSDEKSVFDLAADIGAKVDILVNTTEQIRPGGLLDRSGTFFVREEIDQTFMGFVHLAQAFGPVMRSRGADGANSAAAWVNILSVYALANWPLYGTFSAAQAAALSLSHCLRAELRQGGVRVVNLFSGPTESDWFQGVPPPKVSSRAIADALVAGLRAGSEDIFVGDVAKELRLRLAANPKAVERELAG